MKILQIFFITILFLHYLASPRPDTATTILKQEHCFSVGSLPSTQPYIGLLTNHTHDHWIEDDGIS